MVMYSHRRCVYMNGNRSINPTGYWNWNRDGNWSGFNDLMHLRTMATMAWTMNRWIWKRQKMWMMKTRTLPLVKAALFTATLLIATTLLLAAAFTLTTTFFHRIDYILLFLLDDN